jgi:hypothetical protein
MRGGICSSAISDKGLRGSVTFGSEVVFKSNSILVGFALNNKATHHKDQADAAGQILCGRYCITSGLGESQRFGKVAVMHDNTFLDVELDESALPAL